MISKDSSYFARSHCFFWNHSFNSFEVRTFFMFIFRQIIIQFVWLIFAGFIYFEVCNMLKILCHKNRLKHYIFHSKMMHMHLVFRYNDWYMIYWKYEGYRLEVCWVIFLKVILELFRHEDLCNKINNQKDSP